MTKTALTLSAFAAALYLTVPAWAADYAAPASGCAISETNLKVEAAGGAVDLGDDFDSEGAVRGIGSLSLPLGCMFGAQFDAGAAHFDGTTFAGIGGHLFMRDRPATFSASPPHMPTARTCRACGRTRLRRQSGWNDSKKRIVASPTMRSQRSVRRISMGSPEDPDVQCGLTAPCQSGTASLKNASTP